MWMSETPSLCASTIMLLIRRTSELSHCSTAVVRRSPSGGAEVGLLQGQRAACRCPAGPRWTLKFSEHVVEADAPVDDRDLAMQVARGGQHRHDLGLREELGLVDAVAPRGIVVATMSLPFRRLTGSMPSRVRGGHGQLVTDGRSVGRDHGFERKAQSLPVGHHAGKGIFFHADTQAEVLGPSVARVEQPVRPLAPGIAAVGDEFSHDSLGISPIFAGTPEIQRVERKKISIVHQGQTGVLVSTEQLGERPVP